MRAPDEVLALVDVGSGDHLAPGWLALLDELQVSDYCATPDWALAWWETTGGRSPATIAVWRDGAGATEAIVPLYRQAEALHHRVPLRISAWTNLGGGKGTADHLRLPSRADVWRDVESWLRTWRRFEPIHVRSLDTAATMPLAGGWARPVVTESLVCPRLPIADVDPVPTPYRKRLDYYRRRLLGDGVTLTVTGPGATTPAQFETLFDLHESRWTAATGVRPTHLRSRAAFFAQLVARGTDRRGPVLVAAHDGQDVVGMLLGFRYRGTFAYFQSGWAPGYANRNLGSVLVDEAIGWARRDGADLFDFMRGSAEFKYRFGATDRVDRSVLAPRGPGGLLLAAKYRTARRRLGDRP